MSAKNHATTMNNTALRSAVSWSDIAEYVEKKPGNQWLKFNRSLFFGLAAVFFVVAVVLITSGLIADDATPVVAGGASAMVSLFIVVGIFQAKAQYTKEVRLSRFATDNGLGYTPKQGRLSRNGMIFDIGHSHAAFDIVYSGANSSLPFETGTYRYTIGHGKNSQTLYWRFVGIQMDRHLPNIVLDATNNNFRLFGKNISSNLPVSLKNSQRLSLEGDFDSHFSLFAPKGYERDALYIFTPDLMALLIDGAHDFDAEVVDNTVFFYQKAGYSDTVTGSPAEYYERISQIIGVIGAKMDRQTDYYADERVGDRTVDVVAPEGQRLKRGVSTAVIIFAIIYVMFRLIEVFLDLVN